MHRQQQQKIQTFWEKTGRTLKDQREGFSGL